jgi:hypothetical protein
LFTVLGLLLLLFFVAAVDAATTITTAATYAIIVIVIAIITVIVIMVMIVFGGWCRCGFVLVPPRTGWDRAGKKKTPSAAAACQKTRRRYTRGTLHLWKKKEKKRGEKAKTQESTW